MFLAGTGYDVEIERAAARWGVPESWILAVIEVESAFNAGAYRYEAKLNDASYGLMQLLYSTARGLGYTGSPEGLFDPAVNIDYGAKLLAQLRDRFGADFERVYSAYNSGRPDLYLTSDEVWNHVQRAMAALEHYAGQVIEAGGTVYEGTVNQPGAGAAVLIGLSALLFVSRKRR